MSSRTRTPFQSVQTEGALLPMDLLVRVADQDADLDGLKATDYHLGKTEKLGEAVSRSWNRLQGLWAAFRDERLRLDGKPDALGTTETREGWLLPLFEELGYGRLKTQTYAIEGKRYPVSHGAGALPVHLLSYKLDLDRRAAGVAGAAAYAPHAMVQELLNRSDDHLWAVLTNGLKLRLLRDNASLTRPAYVEFDLEAMFEGDAYADFALLWLTAHASRSEGEPPETCWLERWSLQAHEQGTRALDELRRGVEEAISALGAGFIAHRSNDALREALRSGDLDAQDYYRQLLRLVYRLIFLFTAEDRDALLDPDGLPEAKDRYTRYYSTAALRTLAEKRRGSERHADRFEGLKLIMRALKERGEPRLALPALGSFLWSDEAIGALATSKLANEPFLDAVRALSLVEQNGVRRSVDYKHLGPEELGGIYESLLELQPQLNLDAQTFQLEAVAGSERKTTGSYYTKEGLVRALLDTALDPVLDRVEGEGDPEAALLSLKVCDPAVGSGHFLIAAAHRIAGRLARVRAEREDRGEPSRADHRHALRDVISRCVYGVDINPMALELCKVNLWLEALEPGKPLSFLDHHLKVGNGLLGATPAALAGGIPDDAFKPITGDDTEVASEYRSRNKSFRQTGQLSLEAEPRPAPPSLDDVVGAMAALDDASAETVEDVRARAERYATAVSSNDYAEAWLVADAWCAAFVWPKRTSDDRPYPIHEEVFRRIERTPSEAEGWIREEVARLAERYRFFHWHLAFPDVFGSPSAGEAPTDETAGWVGGFDCVLGNPPWERVKLQEKEFFAGLRPDLAAERKSVRAAMIADLEEEDPALFMAFQDAQRKAEGESALLRDSGIYPLCGRGDVNTYSVFAERFRQLTEPEGRAGVIVPTGIATDSTTQYFFRDLIENKRLVSLLSFENEERLFPTVNNQFKFCLLTVGGAATRTIEPDFVFFARQPVHLREEDRRYQLSAEDFTRLNPNTKTSPTFRWRRDAELTKAIYRRVPVLLEEGPPERSPWRVSFGTLFHMSGDSRTFQTQDDLEAEGGRLDQSWYVRPDGARDAPLYEAKMIWHFDPRFGTYEGQTQKQANKGVLPHVTPDQHADPDFATVPRYWVPEGALDEKLRSAIRMPTPLLDAYNQEDVDGVLRHLAVWVGGHLLNRPDDAARLRGASLLAHVYKNGPGGPLAAFIEEETARAIAREYPLYGEDLDDLRDSADARGATGRLLARRGPSWLMGFRNICRSTDARTAIFSVLPRTAAADPLPLLYSKTAPSAGFELLHAELSSFAFDYVTRQKLGGTHLTYTYLRQLPVLPPAVYAAPCPWSPSESLADWLRPRVLELTYTAWELKPWAEDAGYDGPPFVWDEERRSRLRAEIDAAFFALYLGTEEEWAAEPKALRQSFASPHEAVAYMVDSFFVVRKHDVKAHGSFRTKDMILAVHDRLAKAVGGGAAYETILDPPPASPAVAHPAREVEA